MKNILLLIISFCFLQCNSAFFDTRGNGYNKNSNSYKNIDIEFDDYFGTWKKENHNLFITFYPDNVYIVCSYKQGRNSHGNIISSIGIFDIFENRLVLIDDKSSIQKEYQLEAQGGYLIINHLSESPMNQLAGNWVKSPAISEYGWISKPIKPWHPVNPPIIDRPPETVIVEHPAPPKDNFRPRPQNPIKKPDNKSNEKLVKPPKAGTVEPIIKKVKEEEQTSFMDNTRDKPVKLKNKIVK